MLPSVIGGPGECLRTEAADCEALVPSTKANVGVLHAPIVRYRPSIFRTRVQCQFAQVLDIAVDVEFRMHHCHVGREEPHMHLGRLAGT
jgi:hypothetical protein